MQTVSKYEKECNFCKSIYTAITYYDNGVDWLGHARGSSKSTTEDNCPYCNFDVKRAYEIIITREEKENLKNKILSERLQGKYLISVRFNDKCKDYFYISDKELDNGLYFIHYLNAYVELNNCILIDNTMDLNQVEKMLLYKNFAGSKVDVEELIKQYKTYIVDNLDRNMIFERDCKLLTVLFSKQYLKFITMYNRLIVGDM